jgi:hypothetical protein
MNKEFSCRAYSPEYELTFTAKGSKVNKLEVLEQMVKIMGALGMDVEEIILRLSEAYLDEIR